MQLITLINQKGRGGRNYSKTINEYYKLLLLTFDTLFHFHYSYKTCETRPVWGEDYSLFYCFIEKLTDLIQYYLLLHPNKKF